MKPIEIATLNIKHKTGTMKSVMKTYLHHEGMIRQCIFTSTLEDPINNLILCYTTYENYIRIIIYLEKNFYNKHLGKLVKDARKKEINRWLWEIALKTAPKLNWLRQTGEEQE